MNEEFKVEFVRSDPIPVPRERKHIYVITTLHLGLKYGDMVAHEDGHYYSYRKRTSPDQREYMTIIRSRTWGWFERLEDAQEAIENNYGDMFENYYGHALIEKVADGVMFGCEEPEEHWYYWKGTWEDGGYVPDVKPESCESVIHFMDRITETGGCVSTTQKKTVPSRCCTAIYR